ncbi:MAG: TetR/AcrR family transcriptional regulator [Burkholderiaceae bacterium]
MKTLVTKPAPVDVPAGAIGPGPRKGARPVRRKATRRAEILRAAEVVFTGHGFEAASVSEIAALADCVEGTIYTYFRSKRDLLDAVLADFYDRLITDIEPGAAAIENTADRLRFLVARHLQIPVDSVGMARLIRRQTWAGEGYQGSALHRLNRRYTKLMVEALEAGKRRGELRADLDVLVARDMIFGGLEHWVWNAVHSGRRFDPPRDAARLVDGWLGGWANPVPSPLSALEQRVTRLEGALRAARSSPLSKAGQ